MGSGVVFHIPNAGDAGEAGTRGQLAPAGGWGLAFLEFGDRQPPQGHFQLLQGRPGQEGTSPWLLGNCSSPDQSRNCLEAPDIYQTSFTLICHCAVGLPSQAHSNQVSMPGGSPETES